MNNNSRGRRNDFQSGGASSLRWEIRSGKNSETCFFMKKWGGGRSFPAPDFDVPDSVLPFDENVCSFVNEATTKCTLLKRPQKDLKKTIQE